MPSHRSLYVLPALTLLLLLSGCGKDATGPQETAGSVSFTYGGAVSGSFQASGNLELDAQGRPQFGNWAAAEREGTELAIFAFQTRTDPRGDLFVLELSNVSSPGTYALDFNGCEDIETMSLQNLPDLETLKNLSTLSSLQSLQVSGRAECRIAALFPNFDTRNFRDDSQAIPPTELIVLLQGSVTVDAISNDRVRGTFQGTGLHVTDLTSPLPDLSRIVTVSGGTFNVPIVTDLGF